MRNLVLFMHVSLDGFVAGPNGEMEWITINDEIFDLAGKRTKKADAALYGRVTYQMMEAYWPTAGDKPDASKHDKEHSAWYNKVEKVVVSKTLQGTDLAKTKIISDNINAEIKRLKGEKGKDILLLGSPSVVHILMEENLIDHYWLFVSPILIGEGMPLFRNIAQQRKLRLKKAKAFNDEVVCMHYSIG
jgi:dihydrofolate reductase